ncbi:hypothetical protein NL676_011882 [Syzygium grande]|nr:hypothetical protein NL676_011882 [Syzygium grande]
MAGGRRPATGHGRPRRASPSSRSGAGRGQPVARWVGLAVGEASPRRGSPDPARASPRRGHDDCLVGALPGPWARAEGEPRRAYDPGEIARRATAILAGLTRGRRRPARQSVGLGEGSLSPDPARPTERATGRASPGKGKLRCREVNMAGGRIAIEIKNRK